MEQDYSLQKVPWTPEDCVFSSVLTASWQKKKMLGFSFLLKLILCWTSTFQQKQQGSEGGVNTWLWVWLHMIVYRHRLYVEPAVQHKVFSRQINSNQQNLLVWQLVFHSAILAMGYVLLNKFIRTNLFNTAINHQHIVSRQTFSEVVSVCIQNEPTCSNHDSGSQLWL